MNNENHPKAELSSASYEDMMKAGMHFGRRRSVFHPGMKPNVYTLKENIYIIDLFKTAEAVKKAVEMIKRSLSDRKTILFVAPTKQSSAAIEDLAKKLNMPYVVDRWLGGTLTNFKTIQQRVRHMEQLEQEQRTGGFEKYTKKERVLKDKEIEKLRKKFDGLRTLSAIPDIMFVASLKHGELPIHEADLTKVKTIAICNTDSDPSRVNIAIPANDNAKRSIDLLLAMIVRELEAA